MARLTTACLAATIAFATASAAPAAGKETFRGEYTVSYLGLTIARASFDSRYDGDSYTIAFGGTAAAPTYTVTDNTLVPPTTTAATAFSASTPIQLGAGMQVSIAGAPNPGDTFSVTTTTMTLGVVRAAQGRDEEAETLLREALAAAERDSKFALLEPLETIARFLRERGREDEAEVYDNRLLALTPAAVNSSARIA